MYRAKSNAVNKKQMREHLSQVNEFGKEERDGHVRNREWFAKESNINQLKKITFYICRNRSVPSSEREDIFHDALIKVMKRVDSLGEIDGVFAYFGAAAHSVACDYLRKRMPTSDEPWCDDEMWDNFDISLFNRADHEVKRELCEDTPEEQCHRKRMISQLSQCLSKLPEKQRNLLIDSAIKRIPFGDLVEKYGSKVDSLRVIAHRARTTLKICMESHGYKYRLEQ